MTWAPSTIHRFGPAGEAGGVTAGLSALLALITRAAPRLTTQPGGCPRLG